MIREGSVIDVFRTNEPVIDNWTFVLADRDPWTGYYSMLGTDDSGRGFSQFCSGFYEPGEANTHLGERPRYLPEGLLNHVMMRLSYE